MTGPAATAAARRNRWAISFADLLLLLLGFFVLLQASGGKRDAMLAQVSAQFGGKAVRRGIELRAADLFLPDEALLSPRGRARLAQIAHDSGSQGSIELSSDGIDSSARRFDGWDLAAARLGAVARALRANGVAQHRLVIRGLDQAQDGPGEGQTIRIATRPSGAR